MRRHPLAVFVALCCVAGLSAQARGETAMTIENDQLTWTIDANGQTTALTDRATGQDWAAPNQPVAVALVNGKPQPASAAQADGQRLRLTFGDAGTATLGLTPHDGYLTVSVESVAIHGLDSLQFLNLVTTLKATDEEPFAVCGLALNLQTNVSEMPGRNRLVKATCYPRFECAGAAVAVVAGPAATMRQVLQQVITDSGTVPQSPVGGPWAWDADIGRSSYFFCTPTEDNVDQIIATMKSIGFNQVEIHGGRGTYRFGDCEPNPKIYPRGRESLKAVIAKLHENGILAGMHPYAFFMDKGCPWVTPVPDPRLKAKAEFTLSADLSLDAKTVSVTEDTSKVSNITGFFERNSVTLMVDQELIVFKQASKAAPYGFLECQRGALGTTAAEHQAGAKVRQLAECFGLFAPDPETSLMEEVAKTQAEFFNECGFDTAYFDALDGEDVLGGREWSWHYGSEYIWQFQRYLAKPAGIEYSTFHHHLWPLRSRHGAWDHPTRAHRYFIDLHVAGNARNEAMFLPSNLGWWAFKNWAPSQTEPTFAEDIEYWCAKAIGTNSGLSLMGYSLHAPGQQRLAAIVKQCEELRHAGYFPDSVRQQLRQPGRDFTLERDGDAWRFREAAYLGQRVSLRDEGEHTWTVDNRFGEQPLSVRIEAMMSCAAEDDPGAVTLASFDRPDEFGDLKTAKGVTMSLEPANGVARLKASSTLKERRGAWAGTTKVFDPPLDLTKTMGLGVWVKGDGKGEVLNFQLTSPPHLSHAFGEHYVQVDFTGWRYFDLVEPDSVEHHLYGWPYTGLYAVYREHVRPNAVAALHLWVGNLPPQDSIECEIRPVKAVALTSGAIVNPSLTVGGRTVTFPTTIDSGAYLESDGSVATLYGPQGEPLAEVAPQGETPRLATGESQLSFAAQSGEGNPGRTRVTVKLRGEVVR